MITREQGHVFTGEFRIAHVGEVSLIPHPTPHSPPQGVLGNFPQRRGHEMGDKKKLHGDKEWQALHHPGAQGQLPQDVLLRKGPLVQRGRKGLFPKAHSPRMTTKYKRRHILQNPWL